MFKNTLFSFKKIAICCIAVLNFCLWSGDSMAQDEHEKMEEDNVKAIDSPSGENSRISLEQPAVNTTPSSSTSTFKVASQKKDPQVSGERKKPEAMPSTMSFNIFLYIVDKFKAD